MFWLGNLQPMREVAIKVSACLEYSHQNADLLSRLRLTLKLLGPEHRMDLR